MSRPSTRLWVLTALATVLAVLVPIDPGRAVPTRDVAAIPDSVCASADGGLGKGVCVRNEDGRIFWLGSLRGWDGVEMYCIDYLLDTDWSGPHERVTVRGGISSSLGDDIAASTLAALTAVASRNPAGSSDEITVAAVELIIRQAMSDVRDGNGYRIPGGLTVSERVKDVSFVPDAVVQRAQKLWDLARVERGPWTLEVLVKSGPDKIVTLGEKVHAVVRGRNGSGKPQAMTAVMSYAGFTGPPSVALGSDGSATITLTASAQPRDARVRAEARGALSADPVIVVPDGWRPNPSPGSSWSVSQRGLIGKQETVKTTTLTEIEVVKHRPTLRTQASANVVRPGASVSDSVVVSGTGGAAGSFDWALRGPVPDANGRCPGVGDAAWETAKTRARGTVRTKGDGVFRTPAYRVSTWDVGCLTYTESRPETPTTEAAVSPAGVPAETVLVQERPCISTVASAQRADVGASLRDRVRVGCVSRHTFSVSWVARGPITPRPGATGSASCDKIPSARWKSAPVAASGRIRVDAPGEALTPAFVVSAPGCYAFSEAIGATPDTAAASTPLGSSTETTLMTRPLMRVVPRVPTGPYRAGSGRVAAGDSGSITVGSLGIRVSVDPVGVRGGAMQLPESPSRAGWLRGTALATDLIGSSVVAAHVSDSEDRAGAFARLARIRPGATVVWTDAAGDRRRFTVTTVSRHPRSRPLPAALFGVEGPHLLRLLTCTGRVRTPGGGFRYSDNLVVTGWEQRR